MQRSQLLELESHECNHHLDKHLRDLEALRYLLISEIPAFVALCHQISYKLTNGFTDHIKTSTTTDGT